MGLVSEVDTRLLLAFWGRMLGIEDPEACWIWGGASQAGKNGKLYGYVQWTLVPGGRRQKLLIHRVAYVLHHGLTYAEIEGMDVHHSCGETLCANPLHLEAMTISAHARVSNIMRWKEDQEWLEILQSQPPTRRQYGRIVLP